MSAHVVPTLDTIECLCKAINRLTRLAKKYWDEQNEELYLRTLPLIDDKCRNIKVLVAILLEDGEEEE